MTSFPDDPPEVRAWLDAPPVVMTEWERAAMLRALDPEPQPPDFSWCGDWRPTEECEAGGYCDYHAGLIPPGVPVGQVFGSKPFPGGES